MAGYEERQGLFIATDSGFMGHSITFGDGTVSNGKFVGKNTYDDWHLIPSTRPIVAQAEAATNYIEIPGRKLGPIDMSEYLTGGVTYGARSGSFSFVVENDHESWKDIRNKIISYLHGKKMKMCLEDDPAYYYEGRFTLNEIKSESWNSTIVIDYAVGPYKYCVVQEGTWIWDTFNFDIDYTDKVVHKEGRL